MKIKKLLMIVAALVLMVSNVSAPYMSGKNSTFLRDISEEIL
jgi:hypothetical protein